MSSGRIDKRLDDLVSNLKLTKPNLCEKSIKIESCQKKDNEGCFPQNIRNSVINNFTQQPIWKQLRTQPSESSQLLSQYDSVVNDNYDDFNTYSFYELKQTDSPQKQSQTEEFSFCQHFESQNSLCGNNSYDDSLNRFASIVDQLKTEGCEDDEGRLGDCNYHEANSHEIVSTERGKFFEQPFYSQTQENRDSQTKRNEYFSGSMLKSAQKSYKNISKKIIEPNLIKTKAQPIYAKLTLNYDKQNNHQNSNICPKTSVISSLTTKKSNYSSVMKKPFNLASKSTSKSILQNPITKVKVKELNEKIRKENQIIYHSELKQRNPDTSPLQSFKKSSIQPHKFSSYKVKLFG